MFIIDEAHMVTTRASSPAQDRRGAAGALVFIFATTEPDKVLTTIRSRTHHYPFRLIPPATLRGLLERICAEEGVTVEPAVFPLVVRAGGGSARDSLSILDQLLAGAGPEGVTYGARWRCSASQTPHCWTRSSMRWRPVTGAAVFGAWTGWWRPATTRAGSPPTCSSASGT